MHFGTKIPTGAKWKATLTVLCTILLLSGSFLAWGIRAYRHELEERIVVKEENVHVLLQGVSRQVFGRYDKELSSLLAARSDIVAAFADRDRQRLLALTAPLYKDVLQAENPFFVRFHFYTPDGRSFLRVQDPRGSDDDFGRIRPMVAAVAKTGTMLKGYEIGKSGLYYLVMAPLFYQGRFAGSVEFGIDARQLIEELQAGSDMVFALLVPKKNWPQVGRARKEVVDAGDFRWFKWKDSLFDALPSGFGGGEGDRRLRVGDRTYNVNTRLTLPGFNGAPVANLAFAMDITADLQAFQRLILSIIALTVVLSAIAFVALHLSFRAIFREIMLLNRSLRDYSVRLKAGNETLEEQRQQLEQVVRERTAHLAKTNEDLSLEIVERKRVEEKLRESEQERVKVQKIARLGHWWWNIATNRMEWSEEALAVFGFEPGRPVLGRDDFIRTVHPADRDYVINAAGEAIATRSSYNIDYRILAPDGSERAIRDVGEPIFDGQGRLASILGTVQDVTLTQKANQQLLLSAHVFESSIEGIIITDANGTIQMVNRAFGEITGYRAEDVIGRNPRLLKSDRHEASFFREMWDSLVRRGQWQGEIWNRRKNGEVYAQWLTITAIRDSQGKTTNYVGVFHDMTEIKLHENQLRYQAHHDALTGLPNRLLFRDRLGVAMMHAQRNGKRVAVLFLDLDNFKRINDSLGHTVGDLLLKEVAERLSGCMRESDTVARYGGDEFIIVLEEVEQAEDAMLAAQRVTQAIEPPFYLQEQELYLTVSLGITFFPDDGHDQEVLIRNADTAMYRAKEIGKNNYQIFTAAMNQRVTRWLSVENSLRKALDREEFLVYYQPKVDLLTGRIAGVEALVRWQHSMGGLISPKEFIPLAEDTGLVIAIGAWVVGEACREIKSWHDRGHRLSVSVNLSPRQFRQGNLVEMVTSALLESELPPNALIFEITEGTVMDNEQKAIELLDEFMRMGIGLSIDDFGTGYSSLYYLKQLPIQELKIDRRFVRDLLKNEDDMAITTAIISMAKSLGLKVVAEGVESVEQFSFLRDKGCEQMQGFLFSRPVPGDELLAMLEDDRRFDVSCGDQGSQKYLPFGD